MMTSHEHKLIKELNKRLEELFNESKSLDQTLDNATELESDKIMNRLKKNQEEATRISEQKTSIESEAKRRSGY